jgi:hypothetical protein
MIKNLNPAAAAESIFRNSFLLMLYCCLDSMDLISDFFFLYVYTLPLYNVKMTVYTTLHLSTDAYKTIVMMTVCVSTETKMDMCLSKVYKRLRSTVRNIFLL